jgi:hypothetical protein
LGNWQTGAEKYDLLNRELESHGISEKYSVMINNPPGFYLVSQRKAVVVPNADINGVKQMAKEFDIDYLILDSHIVPQLADFYQSDQSIPGLAFIFSSGEFKVYAFKAGE